MIGEIARQRAHTPKILRYGCQRQIHTPSSTVVDSKQEKNHPTTRRQGRTGIITWQSWGATIVLLFDTLRGTIHAFYGGILKNERSIHPINHQCIISRPNHRIAPACTGLSLPPKRRHAWELRICTTAHNCLDDRITRGMTYTPIIQHAVLGRSLG